MKRAMLVLLLASVAHAAPPEKWYDAYNRGVSAVNAKSYRAGADALQKSIAETPNEGTGVRAGKQIIVYVPHFWLGIAKFNLGDVDGALREWRTSEEQGVVAKTEYYARMKDWVSRAQTEKQRNAQSAASGPKKQADAEISKALAMQVDALSAGGDRSESYRSAQRKLQEALAQFHRAGTDVNGYASAEQTAREASSLFGAAADEGKKLKAARQATPPPVTKPQPKPVMITNVPAQTPAPVPAPVAVAVDTAPPPVPVETEAEVTARIAAQELRRKQIEAKTPTPQPPAEAAGAPRIDLSGAFRAYGSGDLASAEQQLTRILAAQSAAEAYALRGCVRYTRAMLSRTPDRLLASAAADFKAALQRNRALRLDRGAFSPKLVAFFEQVREQR
ncbi:MAG TPA: hypothetical protein VJZ00_03190 [Thermoanaerobaculia bacterium]|nr:hypothetical protein [Thermoanaerobaculia bacterium]